MKNKLNVLSLFNGMSTGHTALENVGIKVGKYYSSEIKPAAIKLTQHHYPDTIQVGDVTKWKEWDIDWKNIDMVLSGSPCQDLSQAGKISYKHQKGLKGRRSSLFWVFVDILNHIKELNPKVLFLQENVGSAPKKDVGIMSRALGVYPVRINSKLVTAQLRDRYYWSNIRTAPDGMFGDIVTDIPQPKDRKIMLNNILLNGSVDRNKHTCLMEGYIKKNIFDTNQESWEKYIKNRPTGMVTIIKENKRLRLVNKIEMCRLQGFPDDWCDILTDVEAGSLLGDGWTLPIIEHIFKYIK
jgi:site-specific DNA-cytosine methylase